MQKSNTSDPFASVLSGLSVKPDADIEAAERNDRQAAAIDALARLPDFVGPRVPKDRLRAQTGRLADAAASWRPLQSLLLLGPTGAGKTSAMGWIFRKLVALGVRDGGDAWHRSHAMRWLAAVDLERARREHPLGKGDAPEIVQAQHASILFLDDAGWDKDPKAVSEIFNVRYESQRITVCTSGLTLAGFEQHYGAAVARRMTEAGGKARVISLHPKASA